MLGEYLRGKREKAGLSLKDVSSETMIRLEYLKALESEDFGKIPGEVYIRGYIKGYLRLLSVDPSEALSIYNEERIPQTPPTSPLQINNRPGSSFFSSRTLQFIILITMVLPFILFLTYKKSSNNPQQVNSGNSGIEKVVTMIPSPVTSAEADFTNKHLLEIRAVEETWVFLQIDDNLSYSILLKPGQIRTWAGERKFYLKVGNAGGIRLKFDGEDLGAPGKRGRIAKLTLPRKETE